MGTSSAFGGKKGTSTLLPDDFDENQPQQPVSWTSVKSDMSKYISSHGKKGSIKNIASQYIKASGGSKSFARSYSIATRAAGNFAWILNSFRTDGVKATLERLGIQLSGRSINIAFSSLINYISPSSNSKDEIAIRAAANKAVQKLYQYVEDNNVDYTALETMPKDLADKFLCEFIEASIWEKIMIDLGNSFEKYSDNIEKTKGIELEFKDYIHFSVTIAFESGLSSMQQSDLGDAINGLYEGCYSVLEGIL